MNILSTQIDEAQNRAEKLAALVGISDFRVGRHILRDGRNWKSGEVEVSGIWFGLQMPSFSEHLAVMSVNVSKFKDETTTKGPHRILATAKYALNSTEPQNVTRIELIDSNDEVINLLQFLPWANQDWNLSLDGTGYVLLFHTMNLFSNLYFSNPVDPTLKKLAVSLAEVYNKYAS